MILCALLLLAASAAVGLYYYVFSIPEPNGLSLASWPNRFTDNFPGWIEAEGNTVRVADIGLERLDEYGLCLQILDASGREAFSYRKPASWPEAYSAAELAALAEQPYEDGRSVFVSSTDAGAQTWTCLVGFPYPIGKRMIYYNGRTVGRLLPVFAAAAALILGIAAAALFLYGLWLTRRTAAITRGIEAASRREYQALPERGLFSDVNAALNQMDARLRHSEQLRSQTERERREWIAGIRRASLPHPAGGADPLCEGTADRRCEHAGVFRPRYFVCVRSAGAHRTDRSGSVPPRPGKPGDQRADPQSPRYQSHGVRLPGRRGRRDFHP